METPRESKIRARQQRIFTLFLEGNSQREIANIEGVNRKTVSRDLTELQKQQYTDDLWGVAAALHNLTEQINKILPKKGE